VWDGGGAVRRPVGGSGCYGWNCDAWAGEVYG